MKKIQNWLTKEYPYGVELEYVDYQNDLDPDHIQELIKTGNIEDSWDWFIEQRDQYTDDIIKEYEKDNNIKTNNEEKEFITEWCQNNDTSNSMKQLLKNSGHQLFYINTIDFLEEDKSNCKQIIKKYGHTKEEKKDINFVLFEQSYDAPISFYFYADPQDVYDAIYKSKSAFIAIDGAYFSTISRDQGSNWLGKKGIFRIAIPKKNFIANVFLDEAKGTGYGWGEIAGPSYDSYTEAGIFNSTAKLIKQHKYQIIKTEITEEQIQEQRFAKKWAETGECSFGDMNIKRHKDISYENNYPCGNKCNTCGTFWID